MKPADFTFVSDMLKKRSGLVLTADKAYLIESRLMPVARNHGLSNIDDLITKMRSPGAEKIMVDVTEAMTTNESFFFRDTKPFDLFRDKVLPKIIENRKSQRNIRIWCAAASSGQEPYSLAMIVKEQAAKLTGFRFEIIGTDISRDILDKAKKGLYSQFEVQRGLPVQLLVKYFAKKGEHWEIKPEIRQMVTYKEFNLLNNLQPLGKFDIVFCRNVLIYFDPPTKKMVLDNISRQMPEDGALFLGGAETVLGVSDKFKPVPEQRGVYSPA